MLSRRCDDCFYRNQLPDNGLKIIENDEDYFILFVTLLEIIFVRSKQILSQKQKILQKKQEINLYTI